MLSSETKSGIAKGIKAIAKRLEEIEEISQSLEEQYGIMLASTDIIEGPTIHVFAGIDSVGKALNKATIETRDGNRKKTILLGRTKVFQLADAERSWSNGAVYRQAIQPEEET